MVGSVHQGRTKVSRIQHIQPKVIITLFICPPPLFFLFCSSTRGLFFDSHVFDRRHHPHYANFDVLRTNQRPQHPSSNPQSYSFESRNPENLACERQPTYRLSKPPSCYSLFPVSLLPPPRLPSHSFLLPSPKISWGPRLGSRVALACSAFLWECFRSRRGRRRGSHRHLGRFAAHRSSRRVGLDQRCTLVVTSPFPSPPPLPTPEAVEVKLKLNRAALGNEPACAVHSVFERGQIGATSSWVCLATLLLCLAARST